MLTRECQGFRVDEKLVSGLWKFGDKAGVEKIFAFAREWLVVDGEKLSNVHLRKCNKDQWAIAFWYRRGQDEKFKIFFDEMTDRLKRRFGNDFVGWDVSGETYVVDVWNPINV